ncbi:MAG: Arylsulfatase [candidate division BRC1 bacterium ADurb.BinA364]|nr:MAG: Arylsulfatase [candidate division BRC1 bacterium ADurb.BinA364]
MNLVFIMMDTLNRDWLTPYGAPAFPAIQTPNFERLAARSATMLNHWIGSAPTMPARCDLYAGRLQFPFKGWGPLDPYEPHLALAAQRAGTHESRFIGDNAHIFNAGGGFLHTRFDSFELIRGQAGDLWKTHPRQPRIDFERIIEAKGWRGRNWAAQTEGFCGDADFHGPNVFRQGAEWLDACHRHGPFFLMLENFDPHEPWDCPDPYRTMYLDDPSLADPRRGFTNWPLYGPFDRYSKEEQAFLRAQYAAVLTMNDEWLGRLLDVMDRRGLWDTTALFLTADHGFYLGENNLIGKNDMLLRPVISRIPLFAHWPGSPLDGAACAALTTTMDLHPTALEAMGVAADPRVRGRSLAPLLEGRVEKVRESAIYGYFGRGVYCTDRRSPAGSSAPLYQYGVHFDAPHWNGPEQQVKLQEGVWEAGDFLSHAGRPVFRKRVRQGSAAGSVHDPDSLFDLEADPQCEANAWEEAIEPRERLLGLLRAEMAAADFPEEHYARLGL